MNEKLILPAQKMQQLNDCSDHRTAGQQRMALESQFLGLEEYVASLVSRIEWLERVLADNHVQRTLMIEQKFGKPVSLS